MEKLQLNVPDMYADHHVLKVRAVLEALGPGVENIVASAAFHAVAFEYDPAVLSAGQIEAALAEAGYPTAVGAGVVNPVVAGVPVATRTGDPAWQRLGVRISRTDTRDAKPQR